MSTPVPADMLAWTAARPPSISTERAGMPAAAQQYAMRPSPDPTSTAEEAPAARAAMASICADASHVG